MHNAHSSLLLNKQHLYPHLDKLRELGWLVRLKLSAKRRARLAACCAAASHLVGQVAGPLELLCKSARFVIPGLVRDLPSHLPSRPTIQVHQCRIAGLGAGLGAAGTGHQLTSSWSLCRTRFYLFGFPNAILSQSSKPRWLFSE